MLFFFLGNTFTQQRYIKLIKRVSEDFLHCYKKKNQISAVLNKYNKFKYKLSFQLKIAN